MMAAAAFEAAFVAALAPVRRLLRADEFAAARGSPPGPESSPFHPIYNSPPVVAAARWLGALALKAPETEALEALFDEAVRDGLAAPAAGHTEDALALQLAVVFALVFVESTTARPGASRNLLAVLVALWRRDRVPGEARTPPQQLETVDDLLLWLLWLDLFWVGIGFLLALASQTRTEPMLDPAVEFPTVPVGCHHRDLPRRGVRRQDGPIPQSTLDLILPFTCADVFRWTDAFDEPATSEMLRRMVGSLPRAGFAHFEMLLHVASLENVRLAAWCAEEAGMSALDVLAAGCAARGAPGQGRGLAGRAVQRMWRFHGAMARLAAEVPPPVTAAFAAGDAAALRAILGDGRGPEKAISFLTYLEMQRMLGVAPEPFVGLGTDNVGASDGPEDDISSVGSGYNDLDLNGGAHQDLKLEVWFASALSRTAARAADSICTGIRSFLRGQTPEMVGKNLYTIIFCIAATHAAWIRLLELRHIWRHGRRLYFSLTDRSSKLLADVSLCITLLRVSEIPHCAGTADMITAFLDGERTALSRTDLLGLRMARTVEGRCTHGGDAADGGVCWQCATDTPGPGPQSFGGEVFPEDTLANGAAPDSWSFGSFDGITLAEESFPAGSGSDRGTLAEGSSWFTANVDLVEASGGGNDGGQARTSSMEAVLRPSVKELPDLRMYWPVRHSLGARV